MSAARKVVEALLGEARKHGLSQGMKRVALDTVKRLRTKFNKGDLVTNVNPHSFAFGRKGAVDEIASNSEPTVYYVRWGGSDRVYMHAEDELEHEGMVGEAEEPKKGLSPGMKAAAMQVARGIRAPDPLAVSWTGSEAFYVSPPGDYGTVGYSELAMHTRIAGKPILRYALFKSSDGRINWVQVETPWPTAREDKRPGKRITDGTVGELLPHELRAKHGL